MDGAGVVSFNFHPLFMSLAVVVLMTEGASKAWIHNGLVEERHKREEKERESGLQLLGGILVYFVNSSSFFRQLLSFVPMVHRHVGMATYLLAMGVVLMVR
eukprot:3629750-Pyramimonas_sp.AAC.1